jgi:hypothetical protein
MPRGDKRDEVLRAGPELRADDPGLVGLLPEIILKTRVQIGLYDGVAKTPPVLRSTGILPVLHSTVQILDAQGQPILYDQNYDTSAADIRSVRGERAAAIDFAQRVHKRFERDAPYFLLRAADCFKGVVTEIETAREFDFEREEAEDALEILLTIPRQHLEEYLDGVTGFKISKSKGRPPRYTKARLEGILQRAVRSFRKRENRSPTLTEAVNEINKSRPMTLAAMKSLLSRYGLRYSIYKKGA